MATTTRQTTSRSDWAALAFIHLRLASELFGRESFVAAQVIEIAHQRGLAMPASQRAWGPLFRKARNRLVLVEELKEDGTRFYPRRWFKCQDGFRWT